MKGLFTIPFVSISDCLYSLCNQVKQKEREAAKALFSTEEGADMLSTVSEEGKQMDAQAQQNGAKAQLSAEQKAEISRAIEAASTKEEMDLIERQLRVSEAVTVCWDEGGKANHSMNVMVEAGLCV